MPTKKKTKKDPEKKAGPIELPPNQDRSYGPKSYTCRVDREKACELISEHGFFMKADDGEQVHLWADSDAYESYKGSK